MSEFRAAKAALLGGLIFACFLCGCSPQTAAEEPTPTATVIISGAGAGENPENPTDEPTLEPAAPATTAVAPSASVDNSSPLPVTITDLDGNEVTVQTANRIVSLTPATTSILIEEGAGPRIVGTDIESEGVPEAAKCGSQSEPDVAAVLALTPDVVFIANEIVPEAAEQLRAQVTVVSAEARTFPQVAESFSLVGKAAGLEPASTALVSQWEGTLAEVEQQRPATSPVCYYAISFGTQGNRTCGPGSLMNSMIEAAGGTPATGEAAAPDTAEGQPVQELEYTADDLLAVNPDCIIVSNAAGSSSALAADPAFAPLAAVQNGSVFEIDQRLVSEPGTNLNEGLLALSSLVNAAAQPVAPAEEAAAAEEPAAE